MGVREGEVPHASMVRAREDRHTMIHPDHPIETAAEARRHLLDLRFERAIAGPSGLLDDLSYVEQLEDDIAATEHAYVGLVVTEIATLRAEIEAPLRG
jgi:hypothetical protein